MYITASVRHQARLQPIAVTSTVWMPPLPVVATLSDPVTLRAIRTPNTISDTRSRVLHGRAFRCFLA
jgi:hypothetical protein